MFSCQTSSKRLYRCWKIITGKEYLSVSKGGHTHSVGRLTWHNGIIPQTEVWVKLGGDKGGNTTKMNFQIVNVPTPNSIHNTCVFCCFAATDNVTNLHSALDRFRDQVKQLQGMKWRYMYVLILTKCSLNPYIYIQGIHHKGVQVL